MEPRSRPRHSTEYFNVEDYFLCANEQCTNCLQAEVQRPEETHYHCLACHKNLKGSSNLSDLGSRLKKHYKKFPTARELRGFSYPAHRLEDTLRPAASSFKNLTSEDQTLVREGILVYCTAVHNLSWKSQACMSNIIQQIADCNYSSSASKSAAICKGLFGTKAEQELKSDLQKVSHVAIAFDSSSIHNIKVLPLLAIFFHRQKGLQHRLLALVDLKQDGTADCTAWAIKKVLEKYSVEQ